MKSIKTAFTATLLSTLIFSFTKTDPWYLFESNEFAIEFPKKPTENSQQVTTAIGELKMDIYTYEGSSEGDDNFIYGLVSSEYPDSLINSDRTELISTFFRNSVDGAVKNVQGKLISEKAIEINGFPGRELKVDYQNGIAIIKMRMYLIHNKMFALQTITETSKEDNPSVIKFHDSFRLKH